MSRISILTDYPYSLSYIGFDLKIVKDGLDDSLGLQMVTSFTVVIIR